MVIHSYKLCKGSSHVGAKVILEVESSSCGDARSVLSQCIEPPSHDALDAAFIKLLHKGGIDGCGYVTQIGRIYWEMPCDINTSLLILLGNAFGCLRETVLAAAVMSTPKRSIMIYHRDGPGSVCRAFLMKCAYGLSSQSDVLAEVALWDEYERYFVHDKRGAKLCCPHGQGTTGGATRRCRECERIWLREHHINVKALRLAVQCRDDLTARLVYSDR